jgi:hypothetical protein
MHTLKRLHYVFLKRHAHVKPALGDEDGWQTVNDNLFISAIDDLIVYGVGTAWHNLKAGVRLLWRASGERVG